MEVLTDKHALLWVGPDPLPPNVFEALNGQWEVFPCISVRSLSDRLRQAQVVLVGPRLSDDSDSRELWRILDQVDASGSVAVVLLPDGLAETHLLARRGGQFLTANAAAPPHELAAKIEAAAALQPAFKKLRAEADMTRVTMPRAPASYEHFEQEMRLAARLQRDFLPRALPQVGPVRFAALFRPASWVSGDFYDVFRLDETHIGFYVADVVGHGMPAALLTIFVKRALQTKKITGNTYEIVPPEKALAELNADMCQQQLSACQFCTAAYAILDTRALQLRHACGGHPRPLLMRADGSIQSLDAGGPLLGIFPGESFPAQEVALRPGDRVVMYSDGAEEALACYGHPDRDGLVAELQRLRDLSPEHMALRLTAKIDERHGANERCDDITVLIADVAAD